MCGGGGRVKAPDPMKEAQAQIQILQHQYQMDEQRRAAEAQRQAQQEAAERQQWQQQLGQSRQSTRGAIDQQFEQQGLDPTEYDDRIRAALDLAQSGKSFGSSPAFSTDIGSNILGDIRKSTIRDYTRGIDEFAPQGFAQETFGSTADDAVIDAILSEQFGEASDSILRARDRGTLNDQGFRYAMDNLGTQKQAASSRLQDTGGGILEGYRNNLTDIITGARDRASQWDFGETFEPDTYRTRLESTRDDLSGRLEGDIRNAIGGEQFFNISDLIQKGGVGQGSQNTGLGSQSGSLLAAITQRKNEEEKQRGLGTTGSF